MSKAAPAPRPAPKPRNVKVRNGTAGCHDHDLCRLGGFTIFQKFEFDKVQLIHGAYHISKHGEGN